MAMVCAQVGRNGSKEEGGVGVFGSSFSCEWSGCMDDVMTRYVHVTTDKASTHHSDHHI